MTDAEFLLTIANQYQTDHRAHVRLREIAGRLAQDASTIEFLHKRRGELVIERDQYKAALGQCPEGRDVMLAALLAQHETDTQRIAALEAARVPREPTEAMIDASANAKYESTDPTAYIVDTWRAMWDAAQPPSAPAEKDEG